MPLALASATLRYTPRPKQLRSLKTLAPASGTQTLCERRFPIMLVGIFLSSSLGLHSVCEDLALHLAAEGWPVLTTSSKRARLARLFDMLGTVVRSRHDFEVAQVDVYSGRAFLWAEAVCWMLRRLRKPYVLTLHGGNLPKFAQSTSTRVRQLLSTAAEVRHRPLVHSSLIFDVCIILATVLAIVRPGQQFSAGAVQTHQS